MTVAPARSRPRAIPVPMMPAPPTTQQILPSRLGPPAAELNLCEAADALALAPAAPIILAAAREYAPTISESAMN